MKTTSTIPCGTQLEALRNMVITEINETTDEELLDLVWRILAHNEKGGRKE